MKKALLIILALVAIIAFLAPAPQASAQMGTDTALIYTNWTLNVRTNAVSTIPPRTAGKSVFIELQNAGSLQVYYTRDGTTPSSSNGEVLRQTTTEIYGNNTNSIVPMPLLIPNNTGTVTLAAPTTAAGGTQAVNVVEGYFKQAGQ
jgi:hypothetical protein